MKDHIIAMESLVVLIAIIPKPFYFCAQYCTIFQQEHNYCLGFKVITKSSQTVWWWIGIYQKRNRNKHWARCKHDLSTCLLQLFRKFLWNSCVEQFWTYYTDPWIYKLNLPISGPVNRAPATKTVDSGSITRRVKPKTIKIGIYSFPMLDVQH